MCDGNGIIYDACGSVADYCSGCEKCQQIPVGDGVFKWKAGVKVKPCPECGGSGELPIDMASIGLPEYAEKEGSMLCPSCQGTGVLGV